MSIGPTESAKLATALATGTLSGASIISHLPPLAPSVACVTSGPCWVPTSAPIAPLGCCSAQPRQPAHLSDLRHLLGCSCQALPCPLNPRHKLPWTPLLTNISHRRRLPLTRHCLYPNLPTRLGPRSFAPHRPPPLQLSSRCAHRAWPDVTHVGLSTTSLAIDSYLALRAPNQLLAALPPSAIHANLSGWLTVK